MVAVHRGVVVRGVVMDTSGRAVRRAAVSIALANVAGVHSRVSEFAITDARGRFEVFSPAFDGPYVVEAEPPRSAAPDDAARARRGPRRFRSRAGANRSRS